MTHGTIEETYEYRIQKIVAGVLRGRGLAPKNVDELFDFLCGEGSDEFANAVVADMITWDTEENWLEKFQ